MYNFATDALIYIFARVGAQICKRKFDNFKPRKKGIVWKGKISNMKIFPEDEFT